VDYGIYIVEVSKIASPYSTRTSCARTVNALAYKFSVPIGFLLGDIKK